MNYIKYPRTNHLLGSKFLDESDFNIHYQNKEDFQFPVLKSNESFIIEEKMDGIGVGIFFINDAPYIQQRGHIFSLQDTPELLKNFKKWVILNEELIYCIIGNKYTMFGEWLEFKHTVFYNHLPSLFLEYDIYDHTAQKFLSTTKRYKLINLQLPSVKVIQETPTLSLINMKQLLTKYPSSFFNNQSWQLDFNTLLKEFPQVEKDSIKNASYEGFYIKIENEDHTIERLKWIRKEFFDIVQLNQHWKNKPRINNLSYLKT